jgi:hypothetical protein
MESPHDSLGHGVALEEILPLGWQVLPADNTELTVASAHVQTEEALRLLLGLDEHKVEIADESADVEKELERIEFKLNLVLELIGQLAAAQLPMPPRCRARLTAEQVEWDSAAAPSQGLRVLVEIYPRPQFPRSLMLPGRVVSVAAQGQTARTRVVWDPLPEPLLDLFEKFIFRSHRRHIAVTRRAQPR